MKTEKELRQRLQDLETGLRLIASGDLALMGYKSAKVRMIREIEYLKEVLEIK